MNTGRVERRESYTDWRDYLFETPIHNGEFLEVKLEGVWVTVRYESHRRAAYLVLPDGSTRDLEADMVFRWTSR
jgi:beta-galactosidase beta subunit